MAQQTAVDWLVNKFQKFLSYYEGNHKAEPYTIQELSNDFEQAKQMEKEQRIAAQMDMFHHMDNSDYGLDYLQKRDEAEKYAEQYYNETYGNNQNN